MSEFEKVRREDGPKTVSKEELSSFAKAIPRMLRLIPFIKNNPRLYHARLPCFVYAKCYAGRYRFVIGHLLELWEQGYFRDEEIFFYSSTGGFSGCALGCVDSKTGESYGVVASYSDLASATDRIWGSEEMRTVFQPPFSGDRAEFSEFLEIINSMPLDEDDAFLPDLKPLFLKDTYSKITLPDMTFVSIPSGEFLMGYTESTSSISESPFPGSLVIVEGIEMLSTPVTMKMWNSITSYCPIEGLSDDSAVYMLNLPECVAFTQVLSSIDDKYDYRLPTEAEYEYASKAGITSEYCCGYKANEEIQKESNNELKLNRIIRNSAPNSWGLYDMGGLLGQWCSDRFNPVYPVINPYNRSKREGYRVVKGYDCASHSGYAMPWVSGPGFRLVRVAKQVSL